MQWGEGRAVRPQARMSMTARESEILAWVAAGKSDWAIGRILNISGKTVNFHVENAKRKLGVGTRVQAVIAAMRSGLIGH
jgi:LuxR family quorum-sensing system transcriptional regulator SolR